MSATVTYRDITKSYGDVTAVRGFDLEVADGEFLVLVGPSGCGKSTLLRMTAGLERITSGDLEIGGRRVNDQEAGDRDVAMVFQNYALYPHRSVRGNLSYALRLRRLPRAVVDRKVEAVAGMLELSDLLDRRPGQLSGGQAQRVALGRAIVRQPAVFLMDEPLSNLDAKLRAQMRTELVRLHRTVRTTTIYVTHDQVEAMTMGTRIVILDKGELQQVGTPREVYHRPANLFVATFMGAPPMNVLDAGLQRVGDDLAAVTDGVVAPLPPSVARAVEASGTGRSVVLGLRPEDLRVDTSPDLPRPDEVTVVGEVDVVELLGGEAYLHVLSGGQRLTAKIPADTEPAPGERVRLVAPRSKAYLFDAATTRLLGTGHTDPVEVSA